MCIFSGNVEEVGGTKIFARSEDGHQFLAYSMNVSTQADVAMILPLPVVRPCDKIEFIDLSAHAGFFDDLEALFPKQITRGLTKGLEFGFDSLEIHQVGNFEASFVPTLADMDRLDPRFNLPKEVWEKLPQYADFGFAVFKLAAGKVDVHPMALKFPSRHGDKTYFPTFHIHQGDVPITEIYDHVLYSQGHGDSFWKESPLVPSEKLRSVPGGLVHEGPVRRLKLHGRRLNSDTYAMKSSEQPFRFPFIATM